MARGTAAKKAWALYRAKYGTKSRSTGSRSRSTGSSSPRKKPRYIGVLGKAGIVIMGLVPPIISGAVAIEKAASPLISGHKPTIPSRIKYGALTWLNALAKGFSFKEPFTIVDLYAEDTGVMFQASAQVRDVPTGVWWITTLLGGEMFAVDRLVAHVMKRPVKVPLLGYVTGSP